MISRIGTRSSYKEKYFSGMEKVGLVGEVVSQIIFETRIKLCPHIEISRVIIIE